MSFHCSCLFLLTLVSQAFSFYGNILRCLIENVDKRDEYDCSKQFTFNRWEKQHIMDPSALRMKTISHTRCLQGCWKSDIRRPTTQTFLPRHNKQQGPTCPQRDFLFFRIWHSPAACCKLGWTSSHWNKNWKNHDHEKRSLQNSRTSPALFVRNIPVSIHVLPF